MAQIQDPVDQGDDGDNQPEAEEKDVADDAPHDEGEAEAEHRWPVGRGWNLLGLGPAPSGLQRGAALGLGPDHRRKAGGGRRKWRGASSVFRLPPSILRLPGRWRAVLPGHGRKAQRRGDAGEHLPEQ